MSEHPTTLTVGDAINLGMILDAAGRNAPVARLVDGNVIAGTARHVCHESGNFLRSDEDVRDGYLRVTSYSGFEHFWPVRDLMPEVSSGEFVLDYRP